PPAEGNGLLSRPADQIYDWIANLLPARHQHPEYREGQTAQEYREALRALSGDSGSAVQSDRQTGGLVITVAVPLQRYKQVLGAVMVSTSNREIEDELRTVRLELLRIFGVTLLVTVLLSLYLASTIARPIRRLAAAAERARGRGARIEIPDVTGRNDEIGELARSLREMTDALWQRMSAIESFAADVAHEIKNPLSSLRSAVETAARLDDPVKQRRLMAIVQGDGHQPALLHRVVKAGGGLDRAAQRGKRVLDLVRDIRREALDGAHPLPQRIGHLAQRARQLADLVVASGDIGDFDARAAAAGALRRRREPADRPGNRARQIERQQHGHQQRDAKDAQQFEPHGAQLVLDLPVAGRHHDGAEHLLVALQRDGDGDHQTAGLAVALHRGSAIAAQGPQRFAVFLSGLALAILRMLVPGRQ